MRVNKQETGLPHFIKKGLTAAAMGALLCANAFAQPNWGGMDMPGANGRSLAIEHVRGSELYRVSQTITGIPTPHGINVLPVRGKLWVASPSTNSVSRIDAATGKVEMVVPVGKGVDLVATDKLREKTWTTNYDDNSVSVLNTITGVELQRIAVGNQPHGLAIDQARGLVYVANYKDNSVFVFDARTNEKLTSIALGKGPRNIALDPLTGNIFVSNKDENTVSYIDPQRNHEISRMKVGQQPAGLDFDPVTRTLYVSNTAEGNVSVLRNGHEIQRVAVGANPRGIQVNILNNTVFVNVADEGKVAIIDGASLQVRQKLKVGDKNFVSSLDTLTDTLYVTNQASNSISVISGRGSNLMPPDGGALSGFFDRTSGALTTPVRGQGAGMLDAIDSVMNR